MALSIPRPRPRPIPKPTNKLIIRKEKIKRLKSRMVLSELIEKIKKKR